MSPAGADTARFRRELARLPMTQRAVLVLRFFDDLSEQETAAILGCSSGAVQHWVDGGLDRLRAGGLFDDVAATGTCDG